MFSTAHAPASVARSGSVKVIVVMLYCNMFDHLLSIGPFEHEPIGMRQTWEYEHSGIKPGVHFAPTMPPTFMAPGHELSAFFSGDPAHIQIPLVIALS